MSKTESLGIIGVSCGENGIVCIEQMDTDQRIDVPESALDEVIDSLKSFASC